MRNKTSHPTEHRPSKKRFMQLKLNEIELEYSSIYLTNALFGVCQTWIAHGKKESPQEITDFFDENVRGYKLIKKLYNIYRKSPPL